MLRSILFTILGLIAAVIIVFIVEAISAQFFPVPGLGQKMSHEEIRQYLVVNSHLIPTPAMILVVLGHALGTFVGVLIAAKGGGESLKSAYIVLALMFIFALINLFGIPHPTWFAIADMLAILFAGVLALNIGLRMNKLNGINPHKERSR
jgi:hypothetical protein